MIRRFAHRRLGIQVLIANISISFFAQCVIIKKHKMTLKYFYIFFARALF